MSREVDSGSIHRLCLSKAMAGFSYLRSLTWRPGGRDCFNFSAFSLSVITRVYRNREQRTLNLTLSAFFFILTLLASFLLAFKRKSLISLISLGILAFLSFKVLYSSSCS